MRTSLNEIKLIDDHLFNKATTEDRLLFDALRIIDTEMPARIRWQQKTLSVVQQYGRKKLRQEIDAVHRQLFNKPEHRSFMERIMRFWTAG